jgi:hypothetical protein
MKNGLLVNCEAVTQKIGTRGEKRPLRTLLSTKATLAPRTAAARIQGSAFAAQGASALTDRITASSHGGFMNIRDASSGRSDAEYQPSAVCRDSL